MDDQEKEVVSYRKEQALKIIEQYKDLMNKYDLVFNIDVLEKELAKANDEEEKYEVEKKLLDKIDNRRKALEKKEELLDKILKLEKHLSNQTEDDEEPEGGLEESSTHPSNRYRRKG